MYSKYNKSDFVVEAVCSEAVGARDFWKQRTADWLLCRVSPPPPKSKAKASSSSFCPRSCTIVQLMEALLAKKSKHLAKANSGHGYWFSRLRVLSWYNPCLKSAISSHGHTGLQCPDMSCKYVSPKSTIMCLFVKVFDLRLIGNQNCLLFTAA